MVSIKRQCVRAYILLESLIALGIFVSIVTLILGQLQLHQAQIADSRHQQAVLAVVAMAVQTDQQELHLNGVTVKLVKTTKGISIYDGEQEVYHLVKR